MAAVLLVNGSGDLIVTEAGDFITLGDEGDPVPGRAFRWREPAVVSFREPAVCRWREPSPIRGE